MTEPIIRTFSLTSWGTISTSTLAGNHVTNAIYNCITNQVDGKGHYWYVDTDSLNGTGTKIENSLVTGIVLKNTYTNFDGNSKTQKLTVRSGGLNRTGIAFALHPDGESTTITSLTTTSSGLLTTTASMPGALSSFSGECTMTGGYYNIRVSYPSTELSYYNLTSARIADGQTVTGWVIELPDAITIALKASTTANWLYGLHAGKIISPVDLSDYSINFDGSGILVGGPGFYNSTGEGHRWWMRGIGDPNIEANENGSSSKIRVGSVWKTPYILNSGNQAVASSNINGAARLSPYEVRAGTAGRDTAGNTEGIVGTTKYLRKGASGSLNDVINSQNASNNISWLRQYVAGANTLTFHIWKRDVSPTTAQ